MKFVARMYVIGSEVLVVVQPETLTAVPKICSCTAKLGRGNAIAGW